MSDASDTDLMLKKRARRRLVGAVAFAGLGAVVLPMVMDEEPKQQVQDVQIRIPGQDQPAFNPKAGRAAKAENAEAPAKPAERASEKAAEKPAPAEKAAEPPKVERAPEKAAEKPAEKAPEKAPEKSKPEARPDAKPAEKGRDDGQRAADILAGKYSEPAHANGGGQFVILIGAFSNPGNVKLLQGKLGELGIKIYTEALDAPDGKKTRVRAGPFASRDAAEKAAEKMKRIGVNGVVAAKP